MLLQKGGLVGERPADQRWVVDLEVIGVVVEGDAPGRSPRGQLDVFRVDQVFPVADAHEQRRADVARVPER